VSSLADALAFTLHWEGGYTDNPADHGGATNEGITQATYDRYRTSCDEALQSVERIDDSEVFEIYSEMYWTPGHCGDLSNRLASCHFDWCVNHGVTGAIKTLQAALGVTADGVFGPESQAAAQNAAADETIEAYLTLRRTRYHQIANADPTQMQFLAGWLSRVNDLESYLGTLEE
jgi:lysozyme family protein